ncbi:Sterol 24-C-methyltransferase erg-4 [Colletotrichum gloeosporioides]|uniref:Sterol 24-C-methyltransferase n=1 Tax=Colletotrichum gloeosporioides TaxID=474922 RepID=A0A8H4CW48_COLGL|nr:Sterol 24-C-methyltransferase erg-4 [Colletotrichum gloeosporioides]KAF3811087.1 Sterol 24-C-methyltransferase erg-4 [Colletotrichum gloeosporioides]
MVERSELGQVLLARDASFEQILHKGTSKGNVGMSAMLKKDHEAQKAATEDYFRHWDNKLNAQKETKEDREARAAEYDSLTRQYYNLVTDFYEYGFGQCFHFCRPAIAESFKQGIARHEHYLAHMINIKKGMKVLDVGCGVGGPAREIAKFTGAYITGLNINEYQVERAARYTKKERMDKNVQFVQADFMVKSTLFKNIFHTTFLMPMIQNIPFEDNTFDAVYAIEATVHAPSLQAVYSEIHRVLKPGGVFGVYEWAMTESYDNDNLSHRKTRIEIEQGNGIANMVKASEALRAFEAAGFEILENEDMADRPDPSPWYWPLDAGSWRHAQTIGDLLYTFRMTGLGRIATHGFLSVMETLRFAPPGMTKTSDSLIRAADALVFGGREKIFSPMYLMVGRKSDKTE